MIAAAACIYTALMGIISIAFIADWLIKRKEILYTGKFAMKVAAVLILLNISNLFFNPAEISSESLILIVVAPIFFLRVCGFSMLGIYYCQVSGRPSFPFLFPATSAPLPQSPDRLTTEGEIISSNNRNSHNNEDDLKSELVENIQPVSIPDRPPWQPALTAAAGVLLVSILYSVVLFRVFSPQISDLVRENFGVTSIPVDAEYTLGIGLFVLSTGMLEEIFIRSGIQNFLARYLKLRRQQYWLAVLLSTALWTLGHVGVIEPAWVKLAQVFPIGILLGWLSWKYGMESAMLAHGLMNVILPFFLWNMYV